MHVSFQPSTDTHSSVSHCVHSESNWFLLVLGRRYRFNFQSILNFFNTQQTYDFFFHTVYKQQRASLISDVGAKTHAYTCTVHTHVLYMFAHPM